MSPEDKFVLEEFKNSINMVEGRYEVSLPWKVDKKQLPTNLALSRKRLNSTIHKLKQTNKYLEIYDQIIKEQLSLGFIETVPEEDQNRTNVHYLPHLPVIKDSTTTPIRIVFDASARMDKQAPSLNDCLYSGPSLTSHLTDLLLKFRLDPFAVSADISKAFLRVGLQPRDRDYTRFIWLKDLNNEKDLQAYRFRSVLFGATCSPFLLQSTLQHHFETYPTSPEVSFLMTKFYVDNLIGSLPTTVSLYSLYKVAKEVLSDAGMPLREWISNDPTFNEIVKQEGLFAPIIVRAKVLMQKIWKLSKRWDDVLPPELQEEWSKIKKDLENIAYQEFPRFTANRGTNYSLHVFCDASEKAYGAAAYLMDQHAGANLVFSKARVAPLKKKSIPQLELTANYSAVKIADYLRTVFTTDGVKIT
ncbi:uncharacterized protein LOC135221136 [Macrobrachium nipponense]|uniref:uncharacterized protein LOC135221136 n=1 Tax=Macrobrachium nipponense TaxID=159736 RepID=UPI0030C8114E